MERLPKLEVLSDFFHVWYNDTGHVCTVYKFQSKIIFKKFFSCGLVELWVKNVFCQPSLDQVAVLTKNFLTEKFTSIKHNHLHYIIIFRQQAKYQVQHYHQGSGKRGVLRVLTFRIPLISPPTTIKVPSYHPTTCQELVVKTDASADFFF